jgi:NADPH-dependent ferric siderophore reductase
MTESSSMTRHEHHKIRHSVVLRMIEVLRTTRITPHMQRIVFGGAELHGFLSAAPDDHVKLFLPNTQGEMVLPKMGPNGPEFPVGVAPSPARDYTPRNYDPQSNELTIDFVIHGDGPASTWAERAKPGEHIAIGGPRGSFVTADDFDHYVLIGDETALPAIGRRLDEAHAGTRMTVLAEIPKKADRQPLESQADFHVTWLERDGVAATESRLLEQALEELSLPAGDTFYWIAAESRRARSMRQYLADKRGVPKDWIRATGYWQANGDDDEDE